MKKKQINQNSIKFKIFSFKKALLLITGLFFIIGCSNEKEDGNLSNASSVITNRVPKETIDLIAQNFFKNNSPTGKNSIKTIRNSKEYQTSKKASAFYVVNYNEGGFVILAADNRVSPILAYSDTATFSTTDNEIIPPVAYWMESQKKQIQATISSNQIQSKELKEEWNAISQNSNSKTKKTKIVDPDPTNCPDYSTFIQGPLLTTTWGQGDGYNNLVPLSCSYDYYLGYNAATGCVATSMAQIMRYIHKANAYNWSSMPNAGGSSDTQLLMKNAGLSVNMQYHCGSEGSGAYASDIPAAFKNSFGYRFANYGGFSLSTVVQELNNLRPVIITGVSNTGTGHAWVCDGYSQTTFYFTDDYGVCTGGAITYQAILHMNWGWDGQYNGYYSAGGFNPGQSAYNTSNTMIYNIGL
jgi:hypothetical protein